MIHALLSNFAMDSVEIWNVKLIFRIKTGGGGGGLCKLKNKRNIFNVGKIRSVTKSRGFHM